MRPALGHLLHLLVKAELFQAADYVAVTLLNREPPERPSDGPAAKVTTILPHNDTDNDGINAILDKIDYVGTTKRNLSNTYEINKKPPIKHVIPEIIVSEIPEHKASSFHERIVQEKSNSRNETESDMIKFSDSNYDNSSVVIPNISDLLNQSTISSNESTRSSKSIEITNSNNSNTNTNNNSDEYQSNQSQDNIPAFSIILSDNESNNISDNIPNLSIINDVKSSITDMPIPDLSIIDTDFKSNTSSIGCDNEIVNKSDSYVNSTSSNSISNTNVLPVTTRTNSSRVNCHSPLPNLSLNTLLPHFGYKEIEITTNNFDKTPHLTSLDVDNSLFEGNGRFLGSGAFGSVYLAIGLSKNCVAVKKLHLNNVSVVNIDDTVTKQFKNEVEVLSKYQHKNLLSLVGYSCDGPTYCLLYEYISGGALKERLIVR